MPRPRLSLPRVVFVALFGLALAMPIVGAIAQDNQLAVPDFCFGLCGPVLFPTPQDPNGSCGGECLTFLCGCTAIQITNAQNQQIGLACECEPNDRIFPPLNAG